MIARIATFAPMTAEIEAEVLRNLLERFQPALRAQPGLVAGYWLVGEDRILEVHHDLGKCRSHGMWGSPGQCHSIVAGAKCFHDPVSWQS